MKDVYGIYRSSMFSLIQKIKELKESIDLNIDKTKYLSMYNKKHNITFNGEDADTASDKIRFAGNELHDHLMMLSIFKSVKDEINSTHVIKVYSPFGVDEDDTCIMTVSSALTYNSKSIKDKYYAVLNNMKSQLEKGKKIVQDLNDQRCTKDKIDLYTKIRIENNKLDENLSYADLIQEYKDENMLYILDPYDLQLTINTYEKALNRFYSTLDEEINRFNIDTIVEIKFSSIGEYNYKVIPKEINDIMDMTPQEKIDPKV